MYGLVKDDLESVKKKLDKQRYYLEDNTFITDSGKELSLLDVSYSANLSKRYYPRLLNKVNTFISHAIHHDLKPLFLTITLDGFFRDFIYADFSRFTDDLREKYEKHIPNNDRFGYFLDYIDNGVCFTHKDLYKILSYQLHRFNKCETLRSIKKSGHYYSYIRVTEPHDDGVPHFHILMYVPEQYISSLYFDFRRYFPAPQNHKRLTLKNTFGKHKREGLLVATRSRLKNNKLVKTTYYETKGFQTHVYNASGYILKYLLKSFTDLVSKKKIDYLQAWYIFHRIPRLITSHTLISQEIYHKISPLESDWFYLTQLKNNGLFIKDKDNDFFRLNDGKGRILTGDNGLYTVANFGNILRSYGSIDLSIS